MSVPPIKQQERSKWCWAACTMYVCKLFQTHQDLTQGVLVSRILQKPICQTNFPDPSCNIMVDLGVALHFVGHLRGRTLEGRLTQEQIIQIFNTGAKPIGCQIRFPNFGHAVIIADARQNSTGALFLSIADPGTGNIHTISYGEFCSNYLLMGGRWIRTYLTDSLFHNL
jgi:hypothetical protein